MQKLRKYKDTLVGKGSALEAALAKGESEARKVYSETTANYEKMYSADSRKWFAEKCPRNG